MQLRFIAQQKMLGLSDCERLCGRWSRDVEELARRVGWSALPGARVAVPVETALNMLVLSNAMNQGVELHAMATHLPGLRIEALLKLGEDTSNWVFEGTSETEREFWPSLYGSSNVVRPRISSIFSVSSSHAVRQLRYFSQNDAERLSPYEFEEGHSGRTPRFTIDAHSIAEQVRNVCGSPLFVARAAAVM